MTPSSPPSRRVLVTGGAGFIGSHLVDLLLARGNAVTVVDNLSTGRRENLPDDAPHLRFIEADLRDALQAFGKGETFDEIYHLAAAVGVKLIVENPAGAIETNVEQTAAILRFAASRPPSPAPSLAAASHSVTRRGQSLPPTGIPTLIASSSEVYGKSAKDPFSEDDDVVYGSTTVARWSYAASKAIDEYLALAYHQSGRVPAVIARFFNTVGPRQLGDYGMVLPRFVMAALQGHDLEVHDDGRQSRCFCDVRDVVSVLPRLLGDPAHRGRVFNVGSDRPISMQDLAHLVVRTLSSRSGVRQVPYSAVYGAGFEDLRQRRPDLARLRRAVGFEPTVVLEQTIRDIAAGIRAGGTGAGARTS